MPPVHQMEHTQRALSLYLHKVSKKFHYLEEIINVLTSCYIYIFIFIYVVLFDIQSTIICNKKSASSAMAFWHN